MTAKTDRQDVYTRITAKIVAAIEAGAERCAMPWHTTGSPIFRPVNVDSGKGYRGINTVALWAEAQAAGFGSGIWGTYKWHGARQIGNAVPAPLARAIGGAVIAALGIVPTRPERVMPLGDTRLLYMEMSEAAEHFGVARPSSKRDRKSGAKKRKQHEIEEARARLRVVHG